MFSLVDSYFPFNNFPYLSNFDNIINNISQKQGIILLLAELRDAVDSYHF